MTDAFSDLVMPIFREVIDLKDRLSWRRDLPSLEEVKQQTRGWVEAVEQRARPDDGLAAEFALAKYGFVAWIDEVLTDSSWGQSVGWGSEDHVLEWNIYRTNLRAGRFYEKAEDAYEAVSQSRSSTDPLEVYLLCVALGFQGDLRFNQERLQGWVERVYSKVTEASPMAPKPFADDPTGAPPKGLTPRRGPELLLRVSILTAITALATLAGYLASVHYSLSVRPIN
jgi:type IV/VI secretion system ImpK/VasF family protein